MMDRRQLRLRQQVPAPAPDPEQEPEPHYKSVEAAVSVQRPVNETVTGRATQKTPLPHMPEVNGERARPDGFEYASREGTTILEFEEPPDVPLPISVYLEESRNGDLMIRGFATGRTTAPGSGSAPTCILGGSARERVELRLTNEDPTNGIRIAADQTLVNDGWLIPANTTPEPFTFQTGVWAISAATQAVAVSYLVTYEQVFMVGAHAHHRREGQKGILAAAEAQAARLARRMEGYLHA